MNNYILTTDGRAVSAVEKQIRRYLPGLDVRLFQFSPRQAILGAPLVTALETEYPNIGAGPLLTVLGVERMQAVSDVETVAILRARDLEDVAERPVVTPPAVAGLDWHLGKTRTDRAWALLGGPHSIDWRDVRVGQIDTGYTEHPVFGFPNPWLATALARTFVPDVPIGEASMVSHELGNGLDNLEGVNGGHGTRIGSTICGHSSANNFFGVAPKVPLVPVRICDTVWINERQAQFEMAVKHLVDTANVGVINVSLGVFAAGVIKAMRRAVNHAYERGVIVVCAAGNQVNSVVAPARLGRTLALGGVTASDVPWSGSSYGPEVDVSAPAADLRRAQTSRSNHFGYGGGGDGTSYATAMTSGAAALWLAFRGPELAAKYTHPWERVEAFKKLLRETTWQPANWHPGAFGTGILDVEALLMRPLPDPATLAIDAPVP